MSLKRTRRPGWSPRCCSARCVLPFLVYYTGATTLGPYADGGPLRLLRRLPARASRGCDWSPGRLLLGPAALVLVWRAGSRVCLGRGGLTTACGPRGGDHGDACETGGGASSRAGRADAAASRRTRPVAGAQGAEDFRARTDRRRRSQASRPGSAPPGFDPYSSDAGLLEAALLGARGPRLSAGSGALRSAARRPVECRQPGERAHMAACAQLRQGRFRASPTKLMAASAVKPTKRARYSASSGSSSRNCGTLARQHQEHDQRRAQPEGGRGRRAEDDAGEYGERSHGVVRGWRRPRPLIGAGAVSSLVAEPFGRGSSKVYQAGRDGRDIAAPQGAGAARGRWRSRSSSWRLARCCSGRRGRRPQAASATTTDFAPTERQAKVARLVSSMFERSHYRQAPVNDPVSSLVLDRYLESLDGTAATSSRATSRNSSATATSSTTRSPPASSSPPSRSSTASSRATASAWPTRSSSLEDGAGLHARRDLRVRPRARALGQAPRPSSTSSGASASRTTRCR